MYSNPRTFYPPTPVPGTYYDSSALARTPLVVFTNEQGWTDSVDPGRRIYHMATDGTWFPVTGQHHCNPFQPTVPSMSAQQYSVTPRYAVLNPPDIGQQLVQHYTEAWANARNAEKAFKQAEMDIRSLRGGRDMHDSYERDLCRDNNTNLLWASQRLVEYIDRDSNRRLKAEAARILSGRLISLQERLKALEEDGEERQERERRHESRKRHHGGHSRFRG